MNNNRMKFGLSMCLFAALGCVSFAAEGGRDVNRAQGEQKKTLATALFEPIPPVRIWATHMIFDASPQVESIKALDEEGRPAKARPVLRAIGSGIVIDKNGRASRIDRDDLISVGHLIIGGVAENAGESTVRVRFVGGHELTLKPGEVFYVGARERIFRPDQIVGMPLPEKSKALTCGDGPATHCLVCECECDYGEGRCTTMLAVDHEVDCRIKQNMPCTCAGDEHGRTAECVRKFVPKAQWAASR